MSKRTAGIFVIAIMILYVSYTPLQSNFAMHIGNLDLKFGVLDISIALTNKMHIIGFGFLALFLLQYFRETNSKYLKTFLGVMGFGLFIEITQIFFVDGHFRLRDLVSDAAGIAISFILFKLLLHKQKEFGRNKVIILNFVILVLQIVFSMAIYFAFKEISVFIGGEQLRKYL